MDTYEVCNQTGDIVFAVISADCERDAIVLARKDRNVAARMKTADRVIAVRR